MTLWDRAYKITVLRHEKGYAPASGRAGETVWGIDRLHNPPESSPHALVMWAKVDAITDSLTDPRVVASAVNGDAEIKRLAKAIAHSQYWNEGVWERFGNDYLSLLSFDTAFRCGSSLNKGGGNGYDYIVQRAVNEFIADDRARLVEDGRIGAKTWAAYARVLDDHGAPDMRLSLLLSIFLRDTELAENPAHRDNLRGWCNRTAWWASQPIDAFEGD